MTESSAATATRLRHGIAEEVRVLLARKRMSATRLAQELGWTQQYISRRMVGDQAFDADDMEQIARALGVEPHDLLPRRVTREFTDKIALAATPSIPAPRVASTTVPALADRFASATLATVQPSGPRRTAPTGR